MTFVTVVLDERGEMVGVYRGGVTETKRKLKAESGGEGVPNEVIDEEFTYIREKIS